ncbi:DNA methyltransferase [Arthrobacter citreus]|uniref:DNA methyltransferase n=1 Tax=Arthrobacter citreus TaxID=1670 RepID=UPI0036D7F4B8
MHKLRTALATESPIHDTPVGVIHPYWARKPLNIVEIIIQNLSSEGDLVIDPFMGSGTTVFASLKNHRRAIGSDLNPLSRLIVEGLLEIISHPDSVLPEMESLLTEHAAVTLPWYHVDGKEYVERTRYRVVGDFAHGNFTLDPTETITKVMNGDKWGSRRAYPGAAHKPSKISMSDYLEKPINFSEAKLRQNSRIAIPEGACLAHYFTEENQASINVFLSLVDNSVLSRSCPSALKLLLSSALPLLRLSDKKASSQWPYWRPKVDLTSRNPSIVLGEKLKQIRALSVWAGDHYRHLSNQESMWQLLDVPAQELGKNLGGAKAQLVLTDPPYGDQVPYLEYSALWTEILGLPSVDAALRHEIVKSDAKTRRLDTEEYYARLRSGFLSTASMVADDGYLAWFYQDQDLRCWETIYYAAKEAGMEVLDVVPLPKQRRSLKTVTSPNTTLDGDLLCVFRRGSARIEGVKPPSSLAELSQLVANDKGGYFDRYATLISGCLKGTLMPIVATRYKSVKRALADMG